jgi:hypothetical protein
VFVAWFQRESVTLGANTMPETESLEYLQAELSQQIGGFNRSRRFFRSTYFYFTLSTAYLPRACRRLPRC